MGNIESKKLTEDWISTMTAKIKTITMAIMVLDN
jgi:hypothetical protein